MALGFDPSVLLSARGINLPDPMALAQRQVTLGALADQRRLRQEQAEVRARAMAEAEALQSALPAVVRAGFSDESIAAADPRAIPALLKQADAERKGRASADKDTADAESKRTGSKLKVAEHLANEAMWLADHPNLSPEMIANFQKKVAGVGAQDVLTNVPFQDWANPDKAREALRSTGNMFYAVKDRVSQAETGRHNRATEGNAAAGLAQRANESAADRALRMRIAEMQDRRAGESNKVAADAAVGKRAMDAEMKLADDYRTSSKGFQETAGALTKVKAALKSATTNPGSALAAGTAFMKILDPNSVVRESELGMALNASGWFDRAMNIHQKLMNGGVMTPEQARNLGAAADDLFAEAAATQRQIDAAFTKRTKDYGGNPERVIVDLGQNSAGQPRAEQKPPEVGQTFQSLPDPKAFPAGAVFRDPASGVRYRNDGSRWATVR